LTSSLGDAPEALRLSSAVLSDQERVLGRDHPDTLMTRNDIARRLGETGDRSGALRLLSELLPDRERVLGPDHPDTLRTRGEIALRSGLVGDAVGALRLFSALLPDQERILGRDHTDTITTLGSAGIWYIRTGNSGQGSQWLHEGLSRAESKFGTDSSLASYFRDVIHRLGCGMER
jgi:hypothetical protein